MKIAIYPGSFDPVTNGHLNIIRRAAHIFDKLIVCVMVNAGKKPLFSQEERTEMLRRVTRDLPNVEVDAAGELLATYAKRRGSCVVVKGHLTLKMSSRWPSSTTRSTRIWIPCF